MKRFIEIVFLLFCLSAQAQVTVIVSPPKIVGQKAVVSLAITNNLSETVESSRAICFLLDEQGRMVGESAKWVVGGAKDRPALESKKGTTFNFVFTSPRPFATTNLTAKVSFARVQLEGGKLANVMKDVTVIEPPPH